MPVEFMNCRCDLVFETMPSYIPKSGPSVTSGSSPFDYIAVAQYECLRFGKRYGYLGSGVRLVEAPKILRVG